ncbi:MAG: hypothetical protein BWY67_02140 [Bacteroidetes bacterium ADurb.Bin397]|nr:MAG: hypothetical protein BWY67_02140 [Bacteroidetes bacterium ADurb.Bin397]
MSVKSISVLAPITEVLGSTGYSTQPTSFSKAGNRSVIALLPDFLSVLEIPASG